MRELTEKTFPSTFEFSGNGSILNGIPASLKTSLQPSSEYSMPTTLKPFL